MDETRGLNAGPLKESWANLGWIGSAGWGHWLRERVRGWGLQSGLEIIGLCGLPPQSGRSVRLGGSPTNLKAVVLSNDDNEFKGVLDFYSDMVQGLALFSEFGLVGEDVGPVDAEWKNTSTLEVSVTHTASDSELVVSPRMAGTLPTCYAAGQEGALIKKWVHWYHLLQYQVGWAIDKRGHRKKRPSLQR